MNSVPKAVQLPQVNKGPYSNFLPSNYDNYLGFDPSGMHLDAIVAAAELQSYADNLNCSTLVLVNASFSDNTAEGAGGALYVTDPDGFSNFCPDDNQPGKAYFGCPH